MATRVDILTRHVLHTSLERGHTWAQFLEALRTALNGGCMGCSDETMLPPDPNDPAVLAPVARAMTTRIPADLGQALRAAYDSARASHQMADRDVQR